MTTFVLIIVLRNVGIIGTGDGYAVASKGGMGIEGRHAMNAKLCIMCLIIASCWVTWEILHLIVGCSLFLCFGCAN